MPLDLIDLGKRRKNILPFHLADDIRVWISKNGYCTHGRQLQHSCTFKVSVIFTRPPWWFFVVLFYFNFDTLFGLM